MARKILCNKESGWKNFLVVNVYLHTLRFITLRQSLNTENRLENRLTNIVTNDNTWKVSITIVESRENAFGWRPT